MTDTTTPPAKPSRFRLAADPSYIWDAHRATIVWQMGVHPRRGHAEAGVRWLNAQVAARMAPVMTAAAGRSLNPDILEAIEHAIADNLLDEMAAQAVGRR